MFWVNIVLLALKRARKATERSSTVWGRRQDMVPVQSSPESQGCGHKQHMAGPSPSLAPNFPLLEKAPKNGFFILRASNAYKRNWPSRVSKSTGLAVHKQEYRTYPASSTRAPLLSRTRTATQGATYHFHPLCLTNIIRLPPEKKNHKARLFVSS